MNRLTSLALAETAAYPLHTYQRHLAQNPKSKVSLKSSNVKSVEKQLVNN